MSVNDALRAHGVRPAAVADDAALPVTIGEALETMFAAADIVFAGEIVAVQRGEEVVAVRFAVDDGVRGATTGSIYTLREWSGLWRDNASRYVVGQHLLMLLHAPSVAAYATPVADGAISLKGDAATGSADLRWIAVHVAVTDAARLRPAAALRASGGSIAVADARMRLEAMPSVMAASAAAARSLLQGETETSEASEAAVVQDDANARVDRAVVMDMLHAWQQRAERAH
ncbi:hypothetical protein [Terriglobus roseus]|uniref:hypothetical protein n=1 Tax=Terriglobus roseus TaxID=392734 RepID=UPI0012F6E116|nr:hypothetical protein [Terriglobus roseus]